MHGSNTNPVYFDSISLPSLFIGCGELKLAARKECKFFVVFPVLQAVDSLVKNEFSSNNMKTFVMAKKRPVH